MITWIATAFLVAGFIALAHIFKLVDKSKNVITLALDKKHTVVNMVENHDLLSPEKVLEELCINIPNNVKIELESWGTSSDKFIIYNTVLIKP